MIQKKESQLWKQLLQLLAYYVNLDSHLNFHINETSIMLIVVGVIVKIKWNRGWHSASIQKTSLIFHLIFYSTEQWVWWKETSEF